MSSNTYKTDFRKLGILLLPSCLRRPFFAGVLSALLSAFEAIRDFCLKYRGNTLERLKYNGQVCRLEYCLNRIFNSDNFSKSDPSLPRIIVEDTQFYAGQLFLVYRRNSGINNKIPVFVDSDLEHIILNRRANNVSLPADFVVYCPKSIAINTANFSAVVNTYKTQGKYWQLVRTDN